jgi:hypothetical protein
MSKISAAWESYTYTWLYPIHICLQLLVAPKYHLKLYELYNQICLHEPITSCDNSVLWKLSCWFFNWERRPSLAYFPYFEKSNDLIRDQIWDLPACSEVPQPTMLPRAPYTYQSHPQTQSYVNVFVSSFLVIWEAGSDHYYSFCSLLILNIDDWDFPMYTAALSVALLIRNNNCIWCDSSSHFSITFTITIDLILSAALWPWDRLSL